LTHTFAEPITPFTMSVSYWPEAGLAVKSVRHHHGTSNSATVSGPIAVSYP
jgi:hypothetical protein